VASPTDGMLAAIADVRIRAPPGSWTLAQPAASTFATVLLSSHLRRIVASMFRKFLVAGILLLLAFGLLHLVGAVVLGVLYFLGYLFSLPAHPRRNCPACRGRGRHTGWFFSYARRPCRRCAGAGWQHRGGVRAGLGGNQGRQPGRGRGRS